MKCLIFSQSNLKWKRKLKAPYLSWNSHSIISKKVLFLVNNQIDFYSIWISYFWLSKYSLMNHEISWKIFSVSNYFNKHPKILISFAYLVLCFYGFYKVAAQYPTIHVVWIYRAYFCAFLCGLCRGERYTSLYVPLPCVK